MNTGADTETGTKVGPATGTQVHVDHRVERELQERVEGTQTPGENAQTSNITQQSFVEPETQDTEPPRPGAVHVAGISSEEASLGDEERGSVVRPQEELRASQAFTALLVDEEAEQKRKKEAEDLRNHYENRANEIEDIQKKLAVNGSGENIQVAEELDDAASQKKGSRNIVFALVAFVIVLIVVAVALRDDAGTVNQTETDTPTGSPTSPPSISSAPTEQRVGCPNRFSDLMDLSTGQPASQSSDNSYPASFAVDGDGSTFSQTGDSDESTWWRVELPDNSTVDEVQIFGRTDEGVDMINEDFYVRLLKDGEQIAQFYQESPIVQDKLVLSFCGQEVDEVEIVKERNGTMIWVEVLVLGLTPIMSFPPSLAPSITNAEGCPRRFSDLMNLSTGRNTSVSMSSLDSGHPYPAYFAVDGDMSTFTHTSNKPEDNNITWWRVELPENSTVDEVQIFPRTHPCCGDRTRETFLYLVKDGKRVAQFYYHPEWPVGGMTVSFCGEEADAVETWAYRPEVMSWNEVIVWGWTPSMSIAPSSLPTITPAPTITDSPTVEPLVDLSTGQPADQESTTRDDIGGYGAQNAVDGDMNSPASTSPQGNSTWIRIDLKEGSRVYEVKLYRRIHCCWIWVKEFYVFLKKDGEIIADYYQETWLDKDEFVVSFSGQEADQLEIYKNNTKGLVFSEIVVWGKLS